MFAAQQELPLQSVKITLNATLDRGNPVRTDYTVFNKVHLDVRVKGVTQEQGEQTGRRVHPSLSAVRLSRRRHACCRVRR